jgi:hypothetical protein
VLDEGPTITAQTSLADLQTYVGEIRTATDAVTAAAESRPDIDLDPANTAFDLLERLVNALAGDTVGNAAATVNPALSGVRTAYADLRTAIACD